MNKDIKTVTVDRLKNGFLISPRHNNSVALYDDCVFIEGFDAKRLAEEIINMLCVETLGV